MHGPQLRRARAARHARSPAAGRHSAGSGALSSIDAAAAQARFAAARSVRLATLRADGTPRLVPVTFAVTDAAIVIGIDDVKPKSGRPLARLADIEREPRVALLADHYAEDWAQLWWVRVDDTATVHEDGPAHAAAVAELRAKYPQYAGARFAAVIAVTPTAWAGWSAVP